MKKMIKKTSALAISAFVLAQYIPFTALSAYTPGTGSNSIVIHSYTIGSDIYENQKTVGADPTGTTDDAVKVPSSATANGNITYEIYPVTKSGSNYVKGTKLGDDVTNASGELTFSGLDDGVYWINPVFPSTNTAFDNADAFYVQVPGNTSSTVHVYPKNTDNDFDNPTSVNGKKHTVILTKKDAKTGNTITASTATFKVYFKNALGKWEAATPASTYTTDENGQLKITGLPIGQYYFVEQSAPTGYLLDQTPKEFNITGVTDAEVAVNFNNDPELKVGKVIAADAGGSTYNWTITADLPTNRENLSSYEIIDQFKGLTIDTENVTVSYKTKDAENNDVDVYLTPVTDFTAAIGTGEDADKLTITITNLAGLANIPGNNLTITVPSTLNGELTDSSYATGAGAVYNMAQISYTYGYVPGNDPDPAIPDAPNPPVDITEPSPLPDPSDPDDPNTPNPNDPSNPNTPIDVIKPCTFKISNINGGDELGGASYKITTADGTDVTGFTNISDNADDADTDPMLAVVSNLAPGAYKVYQTGVDSLHVLNNTPIDIYVSKDGKIYTDSSCATPIKSTYETDDENDDVLYQVQFVNQPKENFNLPFTGTIATIIFSITGILLMAGTGFLIFILLKKKDDEEEEQENN